MTFRETLDQHIRAIQQRDIGSLLQTLPDDEILLIMSDGRLVRTVRGFEELHRSWFQAPSWSIEFEPVQICESEQLGVAVFHLVYQDKLPDGKPLRETSYLTLVFARRDGKWVMVQDQNTPVKRADV